MSTATSPKIGNVSNFASDRDPASREAWLRRRTAAIDREVINKITEKGSALLQQAYAIARQFNERPEVKAAMRTRDEIGHEAFLALVDESQHNAFVYWQLHRQLLTPSLAWSILRRSGLTNPDMKVTSNPGSSIRLRQSQTSRRSHRSHGPPDSEDDLQHLRPKARAVEVYRGLLGSGERIPVAAMDAALVAAGIQPRSGTDMRVRRDLGVQTACVGKFQGHHEIWLAVEGLEPLRTGGVVTHRRLGETEEEHAGRHKDSVRHARAVLALRARITGQVAA